ncbi:hypothetical protein RN001_002115 [Aquatica leii]|uniref:Tesmin/TSO1-like CXC domain-containing protein n=1 Tax=Aquatica leii TaxID=1421715 RepID=A0AAN7Q4W2_9COLE|nr:hypothetical protein RN001_002115 [Aquatica leii]
MLPILSEDEALDVASKFIFLLYKNKDRSIKNLNELRFLLTTTSNKLACELPPTVDAFRLHLKRCIYQLKIWYSSDLSEPVYENPAKFGWVLKDVWIPQLTMKDTVPADLRKLLSIKCSDKNCNSSKCVCVKQGLKCIIECKCKLCSSSLSFNDGLLDSENEET